MAPDGSPPFRDPAAFQALASTELVTNLTEASPMATVTPSTCIERVYAANVEPPIVGAQGL